jgi:hypothetical protein
MWLRRIGTTTRNGRRSRRGRECSVFGSARWTVPHTEPTVSVSVCGPPLGAAHSTVHSIHLCPRPSLPPSVRHESSFGSQSRPSRMGLERSTHPSAHPRHRRRISSTPAQRLPTKSLETCTLRGFDAESRPSLQLDLDQCESRLAPHQEALLPIGTGLSSPSALQLNISDLVLETAVLGSFSRIRTRSRCRNANNPTFNKSYLLLEKRAAYGRPAPCHPLPLSELNPVSLVPSTPASWGRVSTWTPPPSSVKSAEWVPCPLYPIRILRDEAVRRGQPGGYRPVAPPPDR